MSSANAPSSYSMDKASFRFVIEGNFKSRACYKRQSTSLSQTRFVWGGTVRLNSAATTDYSRSVLSENFQRDHRDFLGRRAYENVFSSNEFRPFIRFWPWERPTTKAFRGGNPGATFFRAITHTVESWTRPAPLSMRNLYLPHAMRFMHKTIAKTGRSRIERRYRSRRTAADYLL